MQDVLPAIGPPGPVHSNVGEAALVDTQKCVVSPRQIGVRPVTLQVGSGFRTSVTPQGSTHPVPPSAPLPGRRVAVGLYVRPASRTSVTTSVSRRHTPLLVTVIVQVAVPPTHLACTRGVLVTSIEGGMLNLIGQVSSSPGPSVLLPAFSVN